MPAWTFARITDQTSLERQRRRLVKPALFIAALLPLYVLVSAIVHGELSANPLEDIRDTTGIWTLRFVLITLAVTPIRRLARWNDVIRLRRMLGLFAFFYGFLHVVSHIWLDQFFDVNGMLYDLAKRPFIMAGYASFLAMLSLAATSTRNWILRLGGRRWRLLHRLVYLSAAAGVVHYYWRVKLDPAAPVLYGIVLAGLLALRYRRPVATE